MPRLGQLLRFLVSLALAVELAPPSRAAIVINEIMYNSPGSPDVEYVELYNDGPQAQNLNGWYLLDDDNDHPRCMLSGTLAPGAYLVVAGSLSAFAAAYPNVSNVNPDEFDSAVAGQGFSLGNDTDEVRVFRLSGSLEDEVAYAEGGAWPASADGGGPALELIHPGLNNALAASWAAGIPGGTPGSQNSTFVEDLPPTIGAVERDPALPAAGEPVHIRAAVSDVEGLVAVDLMVDVGSGYGAIPMADDGASEDGTAGDGIWGASIPAQPSGRLVRYWITATDDAAQESREPAGAPADYHAYTVDHVPPPLYISEILASNLTGVTDEFSEREDWIELYNAGPGTVNPVGMFLTNDLAATRLWALPALSILPGGRVVIWADDQVTQGPRHASFKLAREGGAIGLYDSVNHGNVRIDGFRYGRQSADHSFGKRHAGADRPEYLLSATPGTDNATSALLSPVCINEFRAASSIGALDWIEIYNQESTLVDISGWHLSDDNAQPTRHTFPPGTQLPAHGRLLLDETDLGFALAAGGETILLTHTDGETGLDWVDFGAQFPDVSHGRFPDGGAEWQLFGVASPDLANTCSQGVPDPPPVLGLRFDAPDALAWSAQAGAEDYDVVRGDLAMLRATQGNFAAALGDCLVRGRADARAWAPGVPSPAAGWFYLVRADDAACGFGTWDSGAASQIQSRDPGIGASPETCLP